MGCHESKTITYKKVQVIPAEQVQEPRENEPKAPPEAASLDLHADIFQALDMSNALESRTVGILANGRGVTLRNLITSWTCAKDHGYMDDKSTTAEFAKSVLIPMTAKAKSSYAEYICGYKQQSPPAAQHHVIHSWRSSFEEVLRALADYCCEQYSDTTVRPSRSELLDLEWQERNNPKGISQSFFFCPFSVNQHSLTSKRFGEEECEIDKFHKVALQIYRKWRNPVLLVLDSKCETLTRSCPLEEVHAAMTNGVELKCLGNGRINFAAIDACKARAYDVAQERHIFKKIQQFGVARFNKHLTDHVRKLVDDNLKTLEHNLEHMIVHVSSSSSLGRSTSPFKKRFLVIGQCGDGKSTLISNFVRSQHVKPPKAGMNPRGVTKRIQMYPGYLAGDSNGVEIELYDTPGVGDLDMTPMKLINLLEQCFKPHPFAEVADCPGNSDYPGVHGIIVTSAIPNLRLSLGAQVVQKIVELGIIQGQDRADQWKNVILIGTKRDLADRDAIEVFMHGQKHPEEIESVASLFFREAPVEDIKPNVATVDKNDYSELEEIMHKIPNVRIDYRAPEEGAMAAHMANIFGVANDIFLDGLKEEREKVIQAIEEHVLKLADDPTLSELGDKLRASVLDAFSTASSPNARPKTGPATHMQGTYTAASNIARTHSGDFGIARHHTHTAGFGIVPGSANSDYGGTCRF